MQADPHLTARRVAIAVAPNGGRRSKSDHPALPIAPDELARTAERCRDAGAAMVHIHVRDRDGRHSLDADAYRAATAAIRDRVGNSLVVQVTSESLGIFAPEQQMEAVRQVRPEAVSLALRELVPDAMHEPAFAAFLDWLRAEQVMPQIILYSPEEAVRLREMVKRGLVPFAEVPVLFALGRYRAGETSRPDDLLPFLAPDVAPFDEWMVCAFGRHETACVTAAALFGGDVRVGFENNLHLPDGKLASGNEDLVSAAHNAIAACGLAPASADDLRERWSATLP
jgi:3-keto-5-aminohexanoate cleavage enzyme